MGCGQKGGTGRGIRNPGRDGCVLYLEWGDGFMGVHVKPYKLCPLTMPYSSVILPGKPLEMKVTPSPVS